MPKCEEKLIRKFELAVKRLDTLLDELRLVWPEANYYFNSGGISLMDGPPHDDSHGGKACPEREIAHAAIRADGGDW